MPPPSDEPVSEKPLQQIVDELGAYPIEAFRFVEEGLTYTVAQRDTRREAQREKQQPEQQTAKQESRHLSGQELCEGLREFALKQWGLMSRAVLQRWNVTCTFDFGRIVFALIDAGRMQKTDEDSIEDFRNVYDFKSAFEREYRIERSQDQS
jgi:uncharacterized repeat protein (TIGR04138 family)